MKSEYIRNKNVETITFPCLMKNEQSGNIVLFTDYNKGTIVYTNSLNYPLGYYSNGWMDCKINNVWIPLRKGDSVILKNL